VSVYTPGAGAGDLKIVAMETDQIQPTGLIAASTATSGPVQSVATAGALHHAASVITIAAGVGSLAARATRNGGVLRARKANTADIVVETTGFHLQAGDALSITAVDLYSFTGTNGDLLDVYEEFN
jgi:hypothetical protein